MTLLDFYENTQTILLSIDKEAVDLSLVKNYAIAEGLLPKHEFHITLIGTATGKRLIELDIDFTKVKELSESIEWKFSLLQEYYYIEKVYPDGEKRKSLIQIAELSGLVEFYTKLNELTGEQFAVPFPHITLYTNSTKEENRLLGIGVYSEELFKSLSPRQLVIQ